MLGKDEHTLKDNLGLTYLFTQWPQSNPDGTPRSEAVIRCRTYGRQLLDNIVASLNDPFHYRLMNLWLAAYRRPWDRPRTLDQLLRDLAEKIARGELRVYLHDSPLWHTRFDASPASYSTGETGADPQQDPPEQARAQARESQSSRDSATRLTASAGAAAIAALTLADRRGTPPASLEDAVNRLHSMGDAIKARGYQPKYSDDELLEMARSGNVAQERYHVRFMEAGYLTRNGEPGMLGAPMEGTSGNGAKYWSTTFDQIEDADTDPRLLCGKVGLDYNPDTEYALVVIDTQAARPLTGVASVPATFQHVSEFANRELPDEFPPEFTDQTMNEEFQAKYARHYEAAVREKYLESEGSTEADDFQDYLDAHAINDQEQELLQERMKMHKRVGNNQHYEGNGLTKDTINVSPNQYGAVETLNFERNKMNLQQLADNGAIAPPITMSKRV